MFFKYFFFFSLLPVLWIIWGLIDYSVYSIPDIATSPNSLCQLSVSVNFSSLWQSTQGKHKRTGGAMYFGSWFLSMVALWVWAWGKVDGISCWSTWWNEVLQLMWSLESELLRWLGLSLWSMFAFILTWQIPGNRSRRLLLLISTSLLSLEGSRPWPVDPSALDLWDHSEWSQEQMMDRSLFTSQLRSMRAMPNYFMSPSSLPVLKVVSDSRMAMGIYSAFGSCSPHM